MSGDTDAALVAAWLAGRDAAAEWHEDQRDRAKAELHPKAADRHQSWAHHIRALTPPAALSDALAAREAAAAEASAAPASGSGRAGPLVVERAMTLTWPERIEHYDRETGFPRSLFVAGDGRVVGTWIMGNDYRVRTGYYGGYPAGYLKRIAALFPDRSRVLHVFSGRVDLAAMPGDTVDCNPALSPTYVADAHDLSAVRLADYDLVLCDPPYSVEDAERYQTTMVKRNTVMRSLAAGMREGAHVVWLDQVLPMYRKDEWAVEAVIGMVKSTNHRFRVVTIFRRLLDALV